MATVLRDRTQGRGPGVLTKEDVRALFRLMAEVAQGADSEETVAFSGRALAALFESYAGHLLRLMDEWPDLSKALRDNDSLERARRLRERFLRNASYEPPRNARGVPVRIVGQPQTHEFRNLILGKGMEI